MTEKCGRCGRERAADLLTWSRAEHARFMAAPEGSDSPEELGPAATCARPLGSPGGHTQATQWDCDRATIARLERELGAAVKETWTLGAQLEELQISHGSVTAERNLLQIETELLSERSSTLRATIAKHEATIAEWRPIIVRLIMRRNLTRSDDQSETKEDAKWDLDQEIARLVDGLPESL